VPGVGKRIHVVSESFLCPDSRPLSIVVGRRFAQVRPAPPALQNQRSGHTTLSPSKAPTFPRRAPNRSVFSPLAGAGCWAGCTRFAQLPGQCGESGAKGCGQMYCDA